jgi:hypothetical protein
MPWHLGPTMDLDLPRKKNILASGYATPRLTFLLPSKNMGLVRQLTPPGVLFFFWGGFPCDG